mgnify:CR=1 FL=1
MKFRKKLLVMALTALTALPFNAFTMRALAEENLTLTAKYATEYAIELEFSKTITLDGVTPVITPDGGEMTVGEVSLENNGTRLRITLPKGEKFELDKKYTIDLLGLKDANSLVSFSSDLILKNLFQDDFESYADTAEMQANWNMFRRYSGGGWEDVNTAETGETYIALNIAEDDNKRLVFKKRQDNKILTNRQVLDNFSEYDSYVLSYDAENARSGQLGTYINCSVPWDYYAGYSEWANHPSGHITRVSFGSGDNYWANTELKALDDTKTTVTLVTERTTSASDVQRYYYNGAFQWQVPSAYNNISFKYIGDTGYFGFMGSQSTNESSNNYLYIDNIKAYKPIWDNSVIGTNDIEVTDLKITGLPSDNTWGEGVNLKCEFESPAAAFVTTNYIWYATDNPSKSYPDEWTILKEGVNEDEYAMTEEDSGKYIRCRIEQYVQKGDIKVNLQTLDTLPVYKISAPSAQDVKFTYDKETMKLKLDYTYIDYNNDPEEGTTFLWEESADKNTWTALSETTDTVTLTENDVEKYIRCTVTVKNTAQMGDAAEPVTAVYTLPFKPTATVAVKGNGKVGSRLTATYEYFDENGDKEEGSLANWYRIKNGNKESVGTGFSYIVKSADAGYKIVFGYTPKNAEFPTTGDEVFSDEIKISEQSSGGSSGGSSSGGGGGTYTMPVKETKPADKTNTEKIEKETFPDMKGHWAEKEITALKDAGLINGKENGYCPEDAVTRAEWITMLLRAVGIKTDGNTTGTFSDVNTNDWFFGAVETAYKEGYISGDGENFRPNDKITREEMAKIIISVYEKKLGETEKASLDSFSDKSEISAWASEFVEKAVNLKLMSGVDSEHFMPLKSATRAEAGVIIYRFYSMLSAR